MDTEFDLTTLDCDVLIAELQAATGQLQRWIAELECTAKPRDALGMPCIKAKSARNPPVQQGRIAATLLLRLPLHDTHPPGGALSRLRARLSGG